MRRVDFYKTSSGACPVEEFLDSLSPGVAKKVTWVLTLIEDLPRVPKKWLKYLTDSAGIYEIRVQLGSDIYRILCFFHQNGVVVLTHGFVKKSNKTPKKEIKKAEALKKEWIGRHS
jgi:phage-related protein